MSALYWVEIPSGGAAVVKVGERGYWPAHPVVAARRIASQGDAVTQSALIGSMFGWSVPGARLAVLDAERNAELLKVSP
jgi:hypothetical protein